MDSNNIIIIGAGAAGLIAARELTKAGKKVTILEARNRLGGRIHTFKDKKFTSCTEAGAEFVHGKLETTIDLLKEYKIKYTPAKGQIIHIRKGELEKDKEFVDKHHHLLAKKLKSLKRDLPLQKFIDTHFKGPEYLSLRQSVTGFVQGYESAALERFSTHAFRDDWLQAEEWKQFRVENGYSELINAIADDCRQLGCTIRLSSAVKKINWKKDCVEVLCANGKSYNAQQVVITVPLGILQRNQIRFAPTLPVAKMNAIKELGYGDVIKVLMLFKNKFWEVKKLQERVEQNLDKFFFLFSHQAIPTWWTQFPSSSALLTGWLSGPEAKKRASKTNTEIIEEAKQSLAAIFETDKKTITSKLKAWKVFNWSNDEFTRGSYTYATVNAEKYRSTAGRAEKNTLFFAGEYLSEEPGIVEAALKSGLEVAGRMLKLK